MTSEGQGQRQWFEHAGELHGLVAVFELGDRFKVEVLGEVVAGQEGARSCQQAQGERGAGGAGRPSEALEKGGGRELAAAARAGLQKVGSHHGDVRLGSVGCCPLQHLVGGLVVAEAEFEHAQAMVEMGW